METKKRKLEEAPIIIDLSDTTSEDENSEDETTEKLEELTKTQLLVLLEELREKNPTITENIKSILENDEYFNEKTCENCDTEYNRNSKEKDCLFHPGELETCRGQYDSCDEDHWPDWDPDCHGPRIGSDDSKTQYPSHYIYSCCHEHGGDSDGCKYDEHI